MTRKDYQRAANIVCQHVKAIYAADVMPEREAWNRATFARAHITAAFEALFREDNPRFDAERFRAAIAESLDAYKGGALNNGGF